jgi:CRP/FNR family cyclic AMP-dependent transcriptional regulator
MLLDLAKIDGGLLIINDKPTHQHIADVVGVSREMVTRIMGNMATEGHIEIKGKSISIDRNGLLSNLP